jgi:hypothetical protein
MPIQFGEHIEVFERQACQLSQVLDSESVRSSQIVMNDFGLCRLRERMNGVSEYAVVGWKSAIVWRHMKAIVWHLSKISAHSASDLE